MIAFLLVFVLNGSQEITYSFDTEEKCHSTMTNLFNFFPNGEIEVTAACMTYEVK